MLGLSGARSKIGSVSEESLPRKWFFSSVYCLFCWACMLESETNDADVLICCVGFCDLDTIEQQMGC